MNAMKLSLSHESWTPCEVTDDAFVPELYPAPEPDRSVVCAAGYLGKSRDANCLRLYLDLDFQAYHEIPKAAIKYYEAVDSNDPDSPTRVYLENSANLAVVRVAKGAEASYLSGKITSNYLGSATRSSSGLAPGEKPDSQTDLCTGLCTYACTTPMATRGLCCTIYACALRD